MNWLLSNANSVTVTVYDHHGCAEHTISHIINSEDIVDRQGDSVASLLERIQVQPPHKKYCIWRFTLLSTYIQTQKLCMLNVTAGSLTY